MDEREADAGHDRGHAEPEGRDEDHAPRGPAGGDRRQQDQQRVGRRDEAAGEAEHEQAAPVDACGRRAARGGGGRRRGECSSGPSAARGRARACAWSCVGSCSCVVLVVVVVRGRARGRARARGRVRARRARRAANPRRTSVTSIQPPIDDDRHRRDQRRDPDDEVGRRAPTRPPGPRPRARGSRACAMTLTARPRPSAWRGVPARADEVGGHQRLAVPRRQRVAGAERGGRRAAAISRAAGVAGAWRRTSGIDASPLGTAAADRDGRRPDARRLEPVTVSPAAAGRPRRRPP